jgi:endonuclease YncB( thermonuclease family)
MACPVRRLAFLLGLPVVMSAGPAQVIDGDTLDLAGERIRL